MYIKWLSWCVILLASHMFCRTGVSGTLNRVLEMVSFDSQTPCTLHVKVLLLSKLHPWFFYTVFSASIITTHTSLQHVPKAKITQLLICQQVGQKPCLSFCHHRHPTNNVWNCTWCYKVLLTKNAADSPTVGQVFKQCPHGIKRKKWQQ